MKRNLGHFSCTRRPIQPKDYTQFYKLAKLSNPKYFYFHIGLCQHQGAVIKFLFYDHCVKFTDKSNYWWLEKDRLANKNSNCR